MNILVFAKDIKTARAAKRQLSLTNPHDKYYCRTPDVFYERGVENNSGCVYVVMAESIPEIEEAYNDAGWCVNSMTTKKRRKKKSEPIEIAEVEDGNDNG